MNQSDLIFGIHAVAAALKKSPEQFIELYLLKGRLDEKLTEIVNLGQRNGISVQQMSRKALDDKTAGATHQGVVARIKPAPALNEHDLDKILERTEQPFLLILDGVTDPHNLGACLRCADAAGVDAVVVPRDKSASLNATVRKVACGAAESVPLVAVTNLARTMRHLQDAGVWIVGTAGETDTNLYQTKLVGPMAIAMGAEGKGLRRLTREHCDELVKLPMAGTVSSLNVSVAAGICLYEVVRQRQS
ncbi:MULTISPECIES: 23S rRNA (guanosine(2251)-2'-O)-methyltransferase RlmB [Corallincola]|uniref:23S rRNA (guanosine-2'-O-)-methyltransferase RlmB n=3 Tax=Corallincola TaxID=1775176 RepID=A0A368NLP5_9GAMM|nr:MULTISPECIES: 23S rRNA (guanosine(2251)-2'-O)-methyltransferase RlmB [Corallincola]RCU51517.1 23S rRNA (guanosine(2251)-2'-O)-methyltransferase RlmB [Corallincola holothuriorum]TAA47019.1 23S rRNA (guanosine(2251)-2'-O)-methyltransferase RlmB [Corallincola spongiicola]TCI04673.1 23S rRNA (guanosine(2251)-2'-O)-methyltransferase RlmB [Corallincola luteus]